MAEGGGGEGVRAGLPLPGHLPSCDGSGASCYVVLHDPERRSRYLNGPMHSLPHHRDHDGDCVLDPCGFRYQVNPGAEAWDRSIARAADDDLRNYVGRLWAEDDEDVPVDPDPWLAEHGPIPGKGDGA